MTSTTAPLIPTAADAAREERSARLWRMTREQRVRAMWAGELNLDQLTEWSRRRPDEVPRLEGEFAWITMTMPEYVEAKR